jgi:hypothetical protein
MPIYLTKIIGCLLITGMIALNSVPALAQETPKGKPGDIIWCHDTGRSIPVRKARWRCKGEVVSEERANSIRDRPRQAKKRNGQRILCDRDKTIMSSTNAKRSR